MLKMVTGWMLPVRKLQAWHTESLHPRSPILGKASECSRRIPGDMSLAKGRSRYQFKMSGWGGTWTWQLQWVFSLWFKRCNQIISSPWLGTLQVFAPAVGDLSSILTDLFLHGLDGRLKGVLQFPSIQPCKLPVTLLFVQPRSGFAEGAPKCAMYHLNVYTWDAGWMVRSWSCIYIYIEMWGNLTRL